MWKIFARQLLFILIVVPLTLFIVNSIVASLIQDRDERLTQQTFLGPLRTLAQVLQQPKPGSDAQFAQNLAQLQRSMGDVRVNARALSTFSPEQRQVLQQGKVLDLTASTGQQFAYLMPDQRVLTLQLPAAQSQRNAILLAYLITILLLALLLYAFQVRPFWCDLQKLRAAAASLGAGALDTRVADIRRASSLYPLAERMNEMAARIETLVDGQRELLNAVAHELRTPLARAYFALDMQQGKSAEQIGQLQTMLRDDLAEIDYLVNELLGYGKLDSREPLQCETFAITPLLQDVQAQFATQRIECQAADLIVRADARLLLHVLQNLLKNACRHAKSRVQLVCELHGDEVWLIVDDDGDGVSDADALRIFQPFIRLDDSRSRDTGGVGLGLALVRRIAERHGGRVWVERSVALGGARFVFAWPAIV